MIKFGIKIASVDKQRRIQCTLHSLHCAPNAEQSRNAERAALTALSQSPGWIPRKKKQKGKDGSVSQKKKKRSSTIVKGAENSPALVRRLDMNNQIQIEAYCGMVKKIAKHFCHPGVDFQDLVQEGMIGLITAQKKFDSAKGVQFSTYAYFWVQKAIREYAAKNRQAMSVPEYSKVYREYQDLLLGLEADVRVSYSPEMLIERTEAVRQALARLSGLERSVVISRLQDASLDEVGTQFGFSRERVSQIEKSAHEKLAKRMR